MTGSTALIQLLSVHLSSHEVAAPLLRLRVELDEQKGLDAVSWVMVDKLTTVRRVNVDDRVGSLTSSQVVYPERLLMVFLGIAD